MARVAAGSVFTAAVAAGCLQWRRVDEHDGRLGRLEERAGAADDRQLTLQAWLERVEGKLDRLIERSRGR